MKRRRLGFWESSALGVSVAFALMGACNVYDPSLLTGGPEGQGGTSAAGGEGSGGDSGTGATGGTGGSQGGTAGSSKGGSAGDGGSSATGGTTTGGGTGGSTGGSSTGGTDATGGDAGDPGTGGDAGSSAGSAGKGGSTTGGNAGSGGSGNGGASGSGGAGGRSGGAGGSGGSGGSGGACGKCGCGMPETDTDSDGVPDCIDMCMGVSDADCTVLKGALTHRYSFNGTGTAVMDSKGTLHGTAMGTGVALSGSGTLVLAGGGTATTDPKQYVDLPDTLLTGLTNVTLEAWVNWGATTTSWQRVFDIGSAATATTGAYVFLSPRGSNGAIKVALSAAGSQGETMAGGALINSTMLATGAAVRHFVLAIDATNDTVSLFVDGALSGSVGFTGTVASIVGTSNYLGRSNFTPDPYLSGTFDEFRVYNVAMTLAQARTSRTAGPNATWF